jgi:hypothetical protein
MILLKGSRVNTVHIIAAAVVYPYRSFGGFGCIVGW